MEDLQDFKRYKIGQAAKEIGVKTYVLRFWEGEFDEIEPIRTESGQRLYTEDHIEIIREVKRLLYDEGLTIDGAKRKLRSREHNDILHEVHDGLLAIKKLLGSSF
ncbi:MAG: MerR family transcriptional regulator [Pseudodesulfovibrio sp.]|nr:MerR family transcriptional regulator [Pseudodesulfovibrio sp.]